ncbi:MAG TPA: aldehyde dehydrogenase family protein [Pseudonocardiaceae bacterium]|nr:aldehyde dehydrogenase family protein [Pseudonocardiaceae bacterium]
MHEVDAIEVQPRPCWVAGSAEQGEQLLTVHHPYDGTEIADVAVPGAAQVERAVTAAHRSRPVPPDGRVAALLRAAELVDERTEEIAETVTAENAKPLAAAHAEVADAVEVLRTAAEEAAHVGEVRPGAGMVLTRRWPIGPVLAVTSPSFPLLVPTVQVAAAIAAGSPVVLVPSVATPMTALLLGEVLADTALPVGAFSVLPVTGAALAGLVGDARLPVVSVTGPWPVGVAVPGKHVVADAGGLTVVVCPDADPADVAARVSTAGRTIRVIVPAALADRYLPALAGAAESVLVGNPHDPAVQVGPMIDETAARRMVEWLSGGRLLAGGTTSGACVAPTVVTDLTGDGGDGPVAVVSVVDDVAAAFRLAGTFGHRTGVLTTDVATALDAAADIDAGEVVIGGLPWPPRVSGVLRDFTREQVTVLRSG